MILAVDFICFIYIYHTDGNFILSLTTTHKLKKKLMDGELLVI